MDLYLIRIIFSVVLSAIINTTFAQNDITIDHLTIVVDELETAKKDFKNLGFTIKPGRKHDNSIENAHIKFVDGTALELITASEPRDQLAKTYIDLKKSGDGPVFLCLGINDMETLEELLADYHVSLSEGSYYQWITFPDDRQLSYLFFLKYTQTPVDKKEHLVHQNGATGLKSITLGKENFSMEKAMFATLGPGIINDSNTIFLNHQEIILDGSNISSKRPITSITLLVNDIHETMEQFPKGIPFKIIQSNSIALPKEYCHGIEIVFEQKGN